MRYLFVVALVLWFITPVYAQVPTNTLTPAQCQTLKTDIAADPALAAISQGDARDDQAIANAYNLSPVPDYWVFRHDLARGEILFTKSVTNTSFTFVNTGYITRAQGERDAFNLVFDGQGRTNCALPNIVQAFVDIFSGAATEAVANRTHIQTMCRHKASRIEKLFASNIGLATTCNGGTSTGVNGPCVKTFVGPAQVSHIACALNLP
jgi:hypothetical protein